MHSRSDPGVEANARLTGYAGLALLVLLAVECLTVLDLRRYLLAHALLGFLLIPPLLVKLGGVGYRFARYYTGDARYRAAGPPALGMRLLAPFLVLLTIVLFVSGVQLWLFGWSLPWLAIHHGSFVLWLVALAVHTVNYLRRAPELALADWRDHLAGALGRRSLVAGSLLAGAALAIAMLPFPTPDGGPLGR